MAKATVELRPDAQVQRSPSVLFGEVKGDAVLLKPGGDAYVGLDGVGSEIWRRLETPKRVDALCEEICRHFAGDADQIRRETMEFLAALRVQGLLVVDPVD